MKATLVSLVSLALLGAAGCARAPGIQTEMPTNTVQAKGLEVTVQVPQRYYRSGDTVKVTVTATNTTGKPISIHSPTGAPVLVRIIRYSLLSPEQVHVYPRTTTSNILSWTLPAGQSRAWTLMVPVEPDWPVEEVLYLSAELNGYSQIAPSVAVLVKAPKKD